MLELVAAPMPVLEWLSGGDMRCVALRCGRAALQRMNGFAELADTAAEFLFHVQGF